MILYLIKDDPQVLRMYVLGLRSSWGTSRVRPAWSPSGHILTPALSPFWGVSIRSHACPEDAVHSLNDSYSYFTNVFSLRALHTHVQKYLIIILAWHTFILYITFIRTLPFILYITFIHTLASSFLNFFCSLWHAGCPRLFVSDTVGSHHCVYNCTSRRKNNNFLVVNTVIYRQ